MPRAVESSQPAEVPPVTPKTATMVVAERPAAPERRERLAVNMKDLEHAPAGFRNVAVNELLDVSKAGVVNESVEDAAMPFRCDLLTAASFCDVLRGIDRRAGCRPTRVYLQRVAAWDKLAESAVLTVLTNGKPALNPELFPPVAQAGSAEPPAMKPIQFKTR